MNFQIDQLPIKHFEQLGITRERLKKLPKDEMHNLLSGYPSNMKFLVFKDREGTTQKVNAKLSVYRTNEGTLGLKIHPYREKIKNDMDLNRKELDQLKAGSAIAKVFNNKEYLVQLDRSINELRRVRLEHIKIAEALGSAKLTPNQKADLLSGKPIELNDEHGNITRVNLDLKRPSGICIEPTKEKQAHIHSEVKHQQNEMKQQEQLRMRR